MKDDVRGDEKRGCGRRVDNFLFAVVSSRNFSSVGWLGRGGVQDFRLLVGRGYLALGGLREFAGWDRFSALFRGKQGAKADVQRAERSLGRKECLKRTVPGCALLTLYCGGSVFILLVRAHG